MLNPLYPIDKVIILQTTDNHMYLGMDIKNQHGIKIYIAQYLQLTDPLVLVNIIFIPAESKLKPYSTRLLPLHGYCSSACEPYRILFFCLRTIQERPYTRLNRSRMLARCGTGDYSRYWNTSAILNQLGSSSLQYKQTERLA